MQQINYRSIKTEIEKIVGTRITKSIDSKNDRETEIVNWEKLMIANKIESKFGISINDESLKKADSMEDIIKTILVSNKQSLN